MLKKVYEFIDDYVRRNEIFQIITFIIGGIIGFSLLFSVSRFFNNGRNSFAIFLFTRHTSAALHTEGRLIFAFSTILIAVSISDVVSFMSLSPPHTKIFVNLKHHLHSYHEINKYLEKIHPNK